MAITWERSEASTFESEPIPRQNDQLDAKLIAFYLPQYHPIAENDEWWGTGFTEWRNVTNAKPRYPGHYQPHLPGELGFYDLRLPEVRKAQAQLARDHGIYGFCYYHYWFHGRRLLERPFDEVLASGEPDFPFMLCWANEEWTRNWDASTGEVLIAQQHSEEDDIEHIRWLIEAFKDPRYIKIDGRPVMAVYRADVLPNAAKLAELWRSEVEAAGFPGLYLCAVESRTKIPPEEIGFDSNIGFFPGAGQRYDEPHRGFQDHTVLSYPSAVRSSLAAPTPPYNRFPTVINAWDNTARRQHQALMFHDSTPEMYETWLRGTIASVQQRRQEERFVFIVAWNEWAEGNHLEPDQKYGRAYLEATARALHGPGWRSVDALGPVTAPTQIDAGASTHGDDEQSGYAYRYSFTMESAPGHIVSLATRLVPKGQTIVDLGAGAAAIYPPLRDRGYRYHGMDAHPEAVRIMQEAGIDASACDLNDPNSVLAKLDAIEGTVGAITLIDVIEHLPEPHLLLARLSEWARAHGEPLLLVSVPNVTHVDIALRLLCGRWDPTRTGLLDATHLRFFYRDTLSRMMQRCGWSSVAEDDFEVLYSDQYANPLFRAVPPAIYGAIRTLAENFNPAWNVQQYIWALQPVTTPAAPSSFLEAVAESPDLDRDVAKPTSEQLKGVEKVNAYLNSVRLFTFESARRRDSIDTEREVLLDHIALLQGKTAGSKSRRNSDRSGSDTFQAERNTYVSHIAALKQELLKSKAEQDELKALSEKLFEQVKVALAAVQQASNGAVPAMIAPDGHPEST